MNHKSVDIAIIGGGIIGCAVGMILSQKGISNIAVLEAESKLAWHQSGNNSGVIHSGLYYRPGSQKAMNCITGRERLFAFCDAHDIPCNRCGKLVIATRADELPALKRLEQRGVANGLTSLEHLDAREIRDREPAAQGIAGLFVPQTGIVNYRTVADTYARIMTDNGGTILTNHRVTAIDRTGNTFVLSGRGTRPITTPFIINCAGLFSDRVARLAGHKKGIQIIPFRGDYYQLRPRAASRINGLVYPVPDPAFPFLGVHLTRMIDGVVEAGPNAVLALKRNGYHWYDFSARDVGETLLFKGFHKLMRRHLKTAIGEIHRSLSKRAFTRQLQSMIPSLTHRDLIKGGAGVRAQALDQTGTLLDDFEIIEAPAQLHVLNAPSPAATASLSIADHIAHRAIKQLRQSG